MVVRFAFLESALNHVNDAIGVVAVSIILQCIEYCDKRIVLNSFFYLWWRDWAEILFVILCLLGGNDYDSKPELLKRVHGLNNLFYTSAMLLRQEIIWSENTLKLDALLWILYMTCK